MRTTREVKEYISARADFKSRCLQAAKTFGNDFAYCVTDDNFCDRNIDYKDYCNKKYFCVNVDREGNVYCNRAFNGYLPLLMVSLDCIEL